MSNAESQPAEHNCFPCARCKKPAKLQCPKCIALNLPKALGAFCSQDCFKEAWPDHRKTHRTSGGWLYCLRRGREFSATFPEFEWTGVLRPERVSPHRTIPDGIPKPDYSLNGIPESEIRSKQQKKVPIWTGKDVEGIRAACRLARAVLDKAHAAIAPGVTTDEIDKVVHEFTVANGAYPSPLNYFHFPKSVCTSVNEVICHGIPDCRQLQHGDIVNVDVTVYLNGYHGDLNETYVVGDTSDDDKLLIKVAHDCLHKAIQMVKPGVRYRDVGEVIQRHAQDHGFSVVKSFCGHGIGRLLHCFPNVPHYGRNKAVGLMKEGHVFTIEPMINAGTHRDVMWPDEWTAATADGKHSAQFEHTLLITHDGVEVLTERQPTSPPLWWHEGTIARTEENLQKMHLEDNKDAEN